MGLLDFTATERPLWRRTNVPTSAMLDSIVDFCARFEQQKPQWAGAMAQFAEQAYAEFLFQVNKIEKEGFDTFGETLDAVRKGVLRSGYCSHTDHRLESMCCLYQALRYWFNVDARLSIRDLETSHQLLLGSTKPAFAGHIRSMDHEVVYVKTEEEPGIHVFMWPTEVRSALQSLLKRAESELARFREEALRGQISSKSRIEQLLRLGGSFFLEFENIHPFMDGNGRCGRILLAYLLQSIMPFPNVLFVDSPELGGGDHPPPFVNPIFYYDCFQTVQSPQEFELRGDGCPLFTKESAVCTLDFPRDLTALIIEGVYVGWKRFFYAMEGSETKWARRNSIDNQEACTLSLSPSLVSPVPG